MRLYYMLFYNFSLTFIYIYLFYPYNSSIKDKQCCVTISSKWKHSLLEREKRLSKFHKTYKTQEVHKISQITKPLPKITQVVNY